MEQEVTQGTILPEPGRGHVLGMDPHLTLGTEPNSLEDLQEDSPARGTGPLNRSPLLCPHPQEHTHEYTQKIR